MKTCINTNDSNVNKKDEKCIKIRITESKKKTLEMPQKSPLNLK